jgi:hypothetical protein
MKRQMPQEFYDTALAQLQREMKRRQGVKNKPQPHPTTKLTLKNDWGQEEVDIDNDIISVVLWLNSFPHTKTVFCCQGDIQNHDHTHNYPYVTFLCNDFNTLKKIIHAFELFYQASEVRGIRDCYHEVKTTVDCLAGIQL